MRFTKEQIEEAIAALKGGQVAMRFSVDEVAMKDAYIEALMELAEENPQIVVLDADLMNSNSTVKFLQRFPDRAINCGVQEANMLEYGRWTCGGGKDPLYPHLCVL